MLPVIIGAAAAAQDYAVSIYGPQKPNDFDGILFPADQAIAISNRLSVQRVKDHLQQNSRPKAFFQMGADHQPILKEVYGSSREIPLKSILKNK